MRSELSFDRTRLTLAISDFNERPSSRQSPPVFAAEVCRKRDAETSSYPPVRLSRRKMRPQRRIGCRRGEREHGALSEIERTKFHRSSSMATARPDSNSEPETIGPSTPDVRYFHAYSCDWNTGRIRPPAKAMRAGEEQRACGFAWREEQKNAAGQKVRQAFCASPSGNVTIIRTAAPACPPGRKLQADAAALKTSKNSLDLFLSRTS